MDTVCASHCWLGFAFAVGGWWNEVDACCVQQVLYTLGRCALAGVCHSVSTRACENCPENLQKCM